MLVGALQDKIGQLAVLLSRGWISQLNQAMSQPCFKKPDSSHSILTPVLIPLLPTKERELLERILREKPLRKTRLIHPQSSLKDSSNSSTLFLSIVKSLRDFLPKPFLTISITVRGLFGALGNS